MIEKKIAKNSDVKKLFKPGKTKRNLSNTTATIINFFQLNSLLFQKCVFFWFTHEPKNKLIHADNKQLKSEKAVETSV